MQCVNLSLIHISTEAAVVSVVYGLIYGLLKKNSGLEARMLPQMFYKTVITTCTIQMCIRDRIWGVALPQLADVLGIFLLRQSMRGIPRALIEAARMENVKNLKIMRDIIIPLVRPSIISTGIIFFINSWNEYVWPVLILKSKDVYKRQL